MKLFALSAFTLLACASHAVLIDFDGGEVAVGNTLSNQYTGVTFTGGTGGFTVPNPAGSTQGFATNTDMTIVDSLGTDVGGGLGSPISGLMLHSFDGWLGEDGDAAFTMNFDFDISDLSLAVGGVATTASTVVYALDAGGNIVASAAASGTSTSVLSLTNLTGVNDFVVTMGDFNDWVGVDNINYTVVPEPASMFALGVGALALLRRRKK